MRSTFHRLAVTAALVAGVLGPVARADGAQADPCVFVVTDRCESWAATYDGPAGLADSAEAISVSPNGSRVFVGGPRTVGWAAPFSGAVSDTDYGVLAYEAGTGRQLWVAGYAGPGDPQSGSRDDYLLDLEVSRDGARVFATGYSRDGRAAVDYDWATVALDAATGARVWASRFDGSDGSWDITWDLAVGSVVDRDGLARELVFVTGYGSTDGGARFASTVAYDAGSGQEVWSARIDGGPDLRSVAFTPDPRPDGSVGGLVHVAGDGLVVTYDAEAGQELWSSEFGYGDGPGFAWSVAAGGGCVCVGGWAAVLDLNEGISIDAVAAAYDPRSGQRIWQTRYAGPDDTDDFFEDVALSGNRVYLTGRSSTVVSTAVTAAYDLATGQELWVSPYEGLAGKGATGYSIAAHPGGGGVYVAGGTPFTTVAYDEAGTRLWVGRYTPPGTFDYAYRVAPSPDGSRLYVAGGHYSTPGTELVTGSDFLTLAYDL